MKQSHDSLLGEEGRQVGRWPHNNFHRPLISCSRRITSHSTKTQIVQAFAYEVICNVCHEREFSLIKLFLY